MTKWTMHCVEVDTGRIIDQNLEATDLASAEAACKELYPKPDYTHHWVTSRE